MPIEQCRMLIGNKHLAICISAVAAAAVLAAQDQPPRPTFRTEANYVRVDAYPTKDGAPVADLTQNDFEVLENGVAQRIEQFEHISIRGSIPQEMRREPGSVAESREALQNPRARVFVIFLDTGHVDVGGSHNIRQPLVDALNKLIGEDDLFAVMTPDMSALDLAFARRTTSIEGYLARHWDWGERDKLIPTDPVERDYESCFGVQSQSAFTRELIARRREKRTIDALQDLVRYLRGAREERKAVITITDGWLLYGPNSQLENVVPAAAPGIQINPGTGKLQPGNGNIANTIPTDKCMQDVMFLSHIDDQSEFRDILNEANYANTAFYPLDPRGLAVFDSPITAPLPLNVDNAQLQSRMNSLRTLAENTDGLAMVNSNDLAGSFRKIVNDLSSYYLLGYYSNGKLDGRFHTITVRVKRPGVSVRARHGYLASTPGAAAATAAAAAAAKPAPLEGDAAFAAAALMSLGTYAREVPLRVQAATGWKATDPGTPFVAVEGELSASREFEDMWKAGAAVTIELATEDGPSLASTRVTLAPGSRTFRAALVAAQPFAPGNYVVRTSARPTDSTLPTRDTLKLNVPHAPQTTGLIWIRRGPSTANRETPTADARFRRSEQVKVEVPTKSNQDASARLLDRTGKALAVPVTTALRDDADGSRWTSAQLALAPLAVGDYVIDVADGNNHTFAAFKVIP